MLRFCDFEVVPLRSTFGWLASTAESVQLQSLDYFFFGADRNQFHDISGPQDASKPHFSSTLNWLVVSKIFYFHP